MTPTNHLLAANIRHLNRLQLQAATERTKNHNRKSPRSFVANVPVASQTAKGMLLP